MKVASIALALLSLAAPVAGFFLALARIRPRLAIPDQDRQRFQITLLTLGLGAVLFVPAWFLERWLRTFAGIDDHTRGADLTAFVYALFVAAVEQGLKVLAVFPAWRSRHFERPLDGIVYAAAAALGFITAHNLAYFIAEGASPLHAARATLAIPAHVFFGAVWGTALGRAARARVRDRSAKRRFGGRGFNIAWLGAMIFNGVFDHLVFARGVVAMIAAAPILLTMLVIGAITARDYLKTPPESAPKTAPPATRRQRLLRTLNPPTLRQVREAISKPEHPLMLRWIGFGALVQVGAITTALAAAVIVGHRMGIDFAAVDQGDAAGVKSLGPLMLLGGATLAAFPFAGYLVARASSTRSVLEPAIAAALAIIGALVLLGVAAPITVVFAVGFAPVAFGLACAGAWIGITRG